MSDLFQGIENALTYEEWEAQKRAEAQEEQEDACDGWYQEDFHGDQ